VEPAAVTGQDATCRGSARIVHRRIGYNRVVERTRHPRIVIPIILAVHATIAALTWRDIAHRPARRIRGPKTLWRVASALNTMGSSAYWVIGRRR
jgi:hypothetical protein